VRLLWTLGKLFLTFVLFVVALPVLSFHSFPAPAGLFAWMWVTVGVLVIGAQLAELLGLVRAPFADLEAVMRGGVRPSSPPSSKDYIRTDKRKGEEGFRQPEMFRRI